jgi:hypothetical protein
MIPRGAATAVPISGTERHYRINADSSQTQLSLGSALFDETISEYHGWDIPGYHKRRRSGELLQPTPFEQFSAKGSWTGTYFRYNPALNNYWRTDSNWSHPSTLIPWRYDIGTLRTEARSYDFSPQITQAAANIYASGHDTLTFLAEFRKVIAMFIHAHGNLVNLLSKRPSFRGVKSLSDAMNQHWLEYRYGWRILYFDMVDIANALADLEDVRGRFSERAGSSTSKTTITDASYSSVDFSMTVRVIESKKVSLRGSVTADITPPKFRFNPVLTAWELIRFSFIIDWFIGIGSWLESMSLLAFSSGQVAAGGVKITCQKNGTLLTSAAGAGQSGTFLYNMQNIAEYTVRLPSSVPSLPSVNVRLDVPKFIDLWALFISLLTGKKPTLR